MHQNGEVEGQKTAEVGSKAFSGAHKAGIQYQRQWYERQCCTAWHILDTHLDSLWAHSIVVQAHSRRRRTARRGARRKQSRGGAEQDPGAGVGIDKAKTGEAASTLAIQVDTDSFAIACHLKHVSLLEAPVLKVGNRIGLAAAAHDGKCRGCRINLHLRVVPFQAEDVARGRGAAVEDKSGGESVLLVKVVVLVAR